MFIQKIPLNTTLHKWSYELSDSSKHYIFKIKDEIQQYLIERYSISKNNHVIEAVDDMDELYYSKKLNANKNVFIMSLKQISRRSKAVFLFGIH